MQRERLEELRNIRLEKIQMKVQNKREYDKSADNRFKVYEKKLKNSEN